VSPVARFGPTEAVRVSLDLRAVHSSTHPSHSAGCQAAAWRIKPELWWAIEQQNYAITIPHGKDTSYPLPGEGLPEPGNCLQVGSFWPIWLGQIGRSGVGPFRPYERPPGA
jgi:hypothetical protein